MDVIDLLRAAAVAGLVLSVIAAWLTLIPIAMARHNRPMLKVLFLISCIVCVWAVAIVHLMFTIGEIGEPSLSRWAVYYAPIVPIAVACLLIWLGVWLRRRA